MQLTVWTYEGPPHVGAMRIATAMRDVHYVLHAPQGDTYADLLFTMIERRNHRPPVTYTTFQARDLGSDTAELFQRAARDAFERFQPKAMLVGASCTAELIQDDPAGLAQALKLPIPVVPLELPSYQRKENWGASETFYQLVRALAVRRSRDDADANTPVSRGRPSCNLLGPTALGFRHRDDVREVTRLLAALGIEVNVVAPYGATPADLARLGEADFNVVMYPEIAAQAAGWMSRNLGLPATRVVPIGVQATREFIQEVAALAAVDPLVTQAVLSSAERDGTDAANPSPARAPWYSRSVDSTYLTGKRVFVFGDATHAVAAARVAQTELGFEVVGLGTYSREFAREVREAAKLYGVEPLITDDYLEVEARVAELQPELVLGTQMERHIAKRLGIPCAVISAPVHVQDFPARYSPQMGFEGANVLFDTWVHPLMMGLEEHLLGMFRGDFEFHDGAAPSHLGRSGGVPVFRPADPGAAATPDLAAGPAVTVAVAATAATPVALAEPATSVAVVAALATPSAATGAPLIPHPAPAAATTATPAANGAVWTQDAESELRKIPFFVRGKARRNTERYALDRGVSTITVETLYDAKAFFSSR
jgi:light-independent protochlorophyllide reductase subunit B